MHVSGVITFAKMQDVVFYYVIHTDKKGGNLA